MVLQASSPFYGTVALAQGETIISIYCIRSLAALWFVTPKISIDGCLKAESTAPFTYVAIAYGVALGRLD